VAVKQLFVFNCQRYVAFKFTRIEPRGSPRLGKC